MVKIVVDYSKFSKAAKKMDDYVFGQKGQITKATNEVKHLGSSWKGADYDAFQNAWAIVDENGSANKALEKSLENYAKVLNAVADEYKNAQKKAIDLAQKIK